MNATQFNQDISNLNTSEVVREDTRYTAWNVSNVNTWKLCLLLHIHLINIFNNWDVTNVMI